MNRQLALVAALVAALLVVVFFLFLWSPKNDEIAAIEEEKAQIEQQRLQLERRLAELEEVRANAPEVEAAIVAAESIVPRDLALPAALRQLVTAADDAGVDLETVSPARPVQVPEAQAGLSSIELNLTVSGGYYQIVDFLRRVEDPAITPRGVVWRLLTLSPEVYPTLTATVGGTMFALLPQPAEEGDDEGDEAADGDGGTTGDDGAPADLPTAPPTVGDEDGAQ